MLNAKSSLAAVYAGGYAPALLILYVQIAYGFLSPNEDKELIRQRRARDSEIDREMGYVQKPAWWRRVKNNDHLVGRMSMRDRIAQNVRELGGGGATARGVHQNIEVQAADRERADREIEMASMRAADDAPSAPVPVRPGFDAAKGSTAFSSYAGKSERRRNERAMNAAAELLFPGGAAAAGASRPDRSAGLMLDGPQPPSYTDAQGGQGRGRQPDSLSTPLSPAERSNSTSTAVSLSGQPQQVKSMLDI